MRIKHDLVISNGEVIPYIYIELIDDAEFGKDFFTKDSGEGFVPKLARYIKAFLNNLNSDSAVLIVNGIMIGTMSLSMLLNSYNKSMSESTCNVLDNNIEMSQAENLEKEVTYDILKKANDEEKEILSKNISNYANVNSIENLNKKGEQKTQNNNVSENKVKEDKPVINNNSSNTTNSGNTGATNNPAGQQNTQTNTQGNSQTVAPPPVVEQPKEPEVIETPKQEEAPPPVVQQGIQIRLSTGGTVVQMNLEDYIIGVVAAEMPASFNVEALKAQAIAARTYAMKKTSQGKILQDSVADQVYENEGELRNKWGASFDYYYNRVKSAVDSTKGMVMMYGGNYIEALYHSISNGKTELPKYVWNSNYPYLVSVDSSWDKNVKNYEVTKNLDYQTISSKLGTSVNQDTTIEILSLNESGRVGQVKVGESIFSGVDFRMKLGLRSADFNINKTSSGLQITTRGYGHGVGMSQYGANEMAKQGYGYMQILTHYYTGINIAVV